MAYLAVAWHYSHAGALEKKGRLGALLAGTGHRGAAARPLDGGALTHWGARTPARGPATALRLHRFTA